MAKSVVLASGSAVRARLLRNAGVAFDVVVANVDEDVTKRRCRDDGETVEATALALACEKALAVGRDHPDCLVIGADQIVEQDGHWFDKPEDRSSAADHLKRFRNRSHRLVTAVAIVDNGVIDWHHVEIASMRVRNLSDAFIDAYLEQEGDDVLTSVGAYKLEGRGVQLFDAIEGDFFTILGLPLLPLLGYLRQRAVVAS